MNTAIIKMIGGYLLAVSPLTVFTEEVAQQQVIQSVNITHGVCSMSFPSTPERVSETMAMEEDGISLQYDAYIAAGDANAVFMLLVAQYPDFVDEQFARISLEAFLNGLLTHNPGNQLLYADLILIEGYEGLDFFIRSGAMYFKGRALMVKNQLYLMAMECEANSYDEAHYHAFVSSFSLGG